jgi:hypothetical protein
MRRFWLIITVLSFAGWSQPPQQQAQPPIPVTIEMPPESIWTALLKVVLPTILGAGLGAGITLYGLRQTNKHNATENMANREHQLAVEVAKAEIAAKHRSQDNRWAFRKDVYSGLIKSVSELIDIQSELLSGARAYGLNPDTPNAKTTWLEHQNQLVPRSRGAINELATLIRLSPLATAHWQGADILQVFPSPDTPAFTEDWLLNSIKDLHKLLAVLSNAGRNELWGIADPESKAESNRHA